MILHKNDIPIIKKVCSLYVSCDFSTLESIAKSVELEKYELSSKKLTEILHSAIKYNLVDDITANLIKEKAIRHSEAKGHTINIKLRNSYEKLFKERKQDKTFFPNGHSIINLNISNKCSMQNDTSSQTSLFD